MKFEKYPISDTIKDNLFQLGFNRPTDIQYKSIPPILKGEDVLAIAQTGTGKTAAFAIPLVSAIHEMKSSRRSLGIKCIVLVPTRELAMQIGSVFNELSKHTRTRPFALYGGVEQDNQIQRLQDGIDIVIATPGRMFDLIHQGHLKLDAIKTLVLDEADHMLDLGFIHDIRAIKKLLTRRHQTLFFSATINREIKKLAFSQVKSSAIRIEISPEDPVSRNVTHGVMFVEMDDKRFFLARFITRYPTRRMIVFVRTRVRAERVEKALLREGIAACNIHGGREQEHRTDTMDRFKKGEFNILIATDVSARGIDVPDVAFVINYDLPEKPENYVHRVGRTGRGVKKGAAISFCSSNEKERLEEIEAFLNKKIELLPLTRQEYETVLDTPLEKMSLEEMIQDNEARIKKARKKRKKKK